MSKNLNPNGLKKKNSQTREDQFIRRSEYIDLSYHKKRQCKKLYLLFREKNKFSCLIILKYILFILIFCIYFVLKSEKKIMILFLKNIFDAEIKGTSR